MEFEEVLDQQEETESQDKPVFVCHTCLDVDAHLEASKAALGKGSWVFNLITYLIFAGVAGYMVFDSIQNHRWQANAIYFVVIVALFVFLMITRKNAPKKAMARWEEAIIQRYGSPALHLTTEFYELSLAQSLREDEEQFICAGYSSVKEIVETEKLFLLRHGKNQFYFVAKDGFTRGTAEEFRSFITRKMGGQ